MIDKYKRPRAQRLVPWRGHQPKAPGVTLDVLRRAVWHLLMQQPAAQQALACGAMAAELDPKELRSLDQ